MTQSTHTDTELEMPAAFAMVADVIRNRRTIKRFLAQPVPRDLLQRRARSGRLGAQPPGQ